MQSQNAERIPQNPENNVAEMKPYCNVCGGCDIYQHKIETNDWQ